ncbi:PilZ domain-containing protein [Thiorhodococcus mannitoliphagus]|uniref:PilZ domain-containing protein n=1 Tax=Thiorhodococcus mannitoliphagus TaxID=329406 RepID=A0A6P1E1J9_9GAMM|nr:PilZ domain-containing protein [Thiorhodococcus mannitoliphagus]NEX23201.1 PilZ domain-containing protein [Thiorhodococcus mannitoliphagus]
MHESLRSSRTINRRRYFRRADNCQVQIQSIDAPLSATDACSHYCVSKDVSSGGVRLLADHPYPISAKVLLTMECRENGWTRIISRVGSIVWTKPATTEEHCQLGIQFADVDSPELQALEAASGFH